MNKDALMDAFEDWRPENYYELPKDEQLRIYMKFEQDFCEGQIARAEQMEER